MFYAGQKVKVKSKNELKKHFHVVPDMLQYADQVVTIRWVSRDGDSIRIYDDDIGWAWNSKDFEDAIKVTSDDLLAFLAEWWDNSAMSRELKIVKIVGYIVTILSVLLFIFLIRIIPKIDLIAIMYLIIPIITFAGGITMAKFIDER